MTSFGFYKSTSNPGSAWASISLDATPENVIYLKNMAEDIKNETIRLIRIGDYKAAAAHLSSMSEAYHAFIDMNHFLAEKEAEEAEDGNAL